MDGLLEGCVDSNELEGIFVWLLPLLLVFQQRSHGVLQMRSIDVDSMDLDPALPGPPQMVDEDFGFLHTSTAEVEDRGVVWNVCCKLR